MIDTNDLAKFTASTLPAPKDAKNQRVLLVDANGDGAEYFSDGVAWLSLKRSPSTGLPVVVTRTAAGAETASSVSGGGVPLLIFGPVTITGENQSTYDGQCLEFSSAQTVTLSGAGLTLSFTAIPPASGNASIAFASGATGNGAATTITRTAAANAMFGVQARNAASTFVVTGV